MRRILYVGLAAVLLTTIQPSTALPGGFLEATWSDGTTLTTVSESCTTTTGAPAPYNATCTFTARANSLSAPFRGQCTESISTVGNRRVLGPCSAEMTVTMNVNRVRADRQSPAVYVCNGTTIDQDSIGPEPAPLLGTFTYVNSDGVVRVVGVDVNVTANVVKFAGSRVSIDGQDFLDVVEGRFPVRCATSGNFSGGFSGQYNYVA